MFVCCLFQRSDPVLMQSALYSRFRGGSDEPITARTNLYICLCTQEFDTSHLPDQVQDQVARLATSNQGARRIAGPLTEGPGPTSRPGSLPAPRVASHCPPAGFGRQQFGIASLRSSDGRFYCLRRKRGFVPKFRELKRILFPFSRGYTAYLSALSMYEHSTETDAQTARNSAVPCRCSVLLLTIAMICDRNSLIC
jgi:hypothetical protein